jgi:hypothetical protein
MCASQLSLFYIFICKFGAELHFNCLFIINTPFVVPVVHCSVVTLNIIGIPLSVLETFAEVQTSPTYLLGGISYPNESDFQFLFSGS